MTEDFYCDEYKPSEAELVFSSTTSKKNLSGVRGRASRTGRKGPVMTPVDFLRGREKKAYMKNSEVKVYNMYDEKVLPYEEFRELPIEKQVVLMTKWREGIGTNNIIKDMKISRKKFYSEVLTSLGIETKPRGRRAKREGEFELSSAEEQFREAPETPAIYSTQSAQDPFTIVMSGRYGGQVIASRFARLSRMFDFDGEYEVRLEIREKI